MAQYEMTPARDVKPFLGISWMFLVILFLALVVSFSRLGSLTLFDVDEAVFSEASKEMLESHNWVTPTYNGVNRYDKPILFYWLMVASYKVFGINEFGARFPSALSSLLLVLSIFFFTRKMRDERHAFYAAISCALSLYFLVYSHSAVTDMVLTLFISLSLFSFYLSAAFPLPDHAKAQAYHYGFFLFSALAVLTKGLIGAILPFGVAILYVLLAEGLQGLRKVFSPGGLMLFFLISLPWFAAQIAINGNEFLSQFIVKHHFRRFTGVISGHKGPVYYFIPFLIMGIFPWVSFLPTGIRNALKGKEKPFLFALLWMAFVFGFFSLSTTKLPNYILPALPAAAILISSGVLTEERKWHNVSHLLLLILSVALASSLPFARRYMIASGISHGGWLFFLALVNIALAVTGLLAILKRRPLQAIVSACMIIFLSVFLLWVFPLVNQRLQGSLHKYSLYAKDQLREGGTLIVFGLNKPSIVFYSGHKITSTNKKSALLDILGGMDRAVIITKAKSVRFLTSLGFKVLEKDEQYAILERK